MSWRRRVLRITIWAFLIAMIPVAVTVVRGTLLIAAYESESLRRAATLYDDRGAVIATLGRRQGAYVTFGDLPEAFVNAVIAAEDRRFWTHRGVDFLGIARAAFANIRSGTREQGASTLTQQLAKNLFLSAEKTFVRKGQEAIFAILLETRYTKREIFEMYVNEVYFGEGAYGVDEAARTYFDKSAVELTLPEAAMLTALLRAPSVYSPFKNPELARERRSIVLGLMHAQGYIDAAQLAQAESAPIELAARRGGKAPYFVDYVQQWLINRFGAHTVFNSGLKVWTSLDTQAQGAAEEALGAQQGAIVALDPGSGAIKAMVGGRDYAESQFNRATQSTRQPGSAFKPFVYAAALERGWKMNDLVEDIRRDFGDYTPRNFKNEYWGPVTMKHALVESLNNGTVWLLSQIGVRSAFDMASRLGITTLTSSDLNLALALGGITHGTTPLEMAKAYIPFANGGIAYEPFAVREVRDADGALLYRHRPEAKRVLSREVAFFITDMLQAAVLYGTGTAANIGRPQAGKTGTTDRNVSAWFVGYTPTLTAAVYIGNDDGTPLAGGGGTLAAPTWGRFMTGALHGQPIVDFAVPPNVRRGYPIDIFTGLGANENCPYREYDSFVWGQEPRQSSPCTWGIAQNPGPFIGDEGSGPDGISARLIVPGTEGASLDRGAPLDSPGDRRGSERLDAPPGSERGGRDGAPDDADSGPTLERAFDPIAPGRFFEFLPD